MCGSVHDRWGGRPARRARPACSCCRVRRGCAASPPEIAGTPCPPRRPAASRIGAWVAGLGCSCILSTAVAVPKILRGRPAGPPCAARQDIRRLDACVAYSAYSARMPIRGALGAPNWRPRKVFGSKQPPRKHASTTPAPATQHLAPPQAGAVRGPWKRFLSGTRRNRAAPDSMSAHGPRAATAVNLATSNGALQRPLTKRYRTKSSNDPHPSGPNPRPATVIP